MRIGVDLGGTAVRVVAVRPDGSLAADRVITTAALGPAPEDAVTSLVGVIEEVSAPFAAVAVGIGASGPIDADGIIRNWDTLPNVSGVSIREAIGERLGMQAAIENDSVAFAVGERRFGAGRGAASIIGVTLGTGIGAAFVNESGPFRGGDGGHPEGGHITVSGAPGPCYCGLESCWEQAASRRALERMIEHDGRYPDVASAACDARRGSGEAASVFARYGDAVGAGLITLCSLFRPRRVVVGGGSSAYADLFLARAARAMKRPAGYEVTVELRASQLGVLAGAIGAACLQDAPGTVEPDETTMEAQWPRSR